MLTRHLQVEEDERDAENGQSDVQRSPCSNHVGEGQENQFAGREEILDDDAGEQPLLRSHYAVERRTRHAEERTNEPISEPRMKSKRQSTFEPRVLTDDKASESDASRGTGE